MVSVVIWKNSKIGEATMKLTLTWSLEINFQSGASAAFLGKIVHRHKWLPNVKESSSLFPCMKKQIFWSNNLLKIDYIVHFCKNKFFDDRINLITPLLASMKKNWPSSRSPTPPMIKNGGIKRIFLRIVLLNWLKLESMIM